MSNRESRSFHATAMPDPYWPLGSRFMRREHILARESWLSSLHIKEKADLVFELETVLKGLICSMNLRNHPGYDPSLTVLKGNFHPVLETIHQGVNYALSTTNKLLNMHNNLWIFQHYFDEPSVPESKNIKLFGISPTQETPETSLLSLKKNLLSFLQISTALLELKHVSFRLFYRVMSVLEQTLVQNHFFKPPHTFEFRSEYDFMFSETTQQILASIRIDEAQKRTVPIILFLLRCLNYTHQIDRSLVSQKPSIAYIMLCALKSDIRACISKIGRSSALYFGETFEKELFAISAQSLHTRYASLMYEGSQLLELRVAFNAFVATLKLALQRNSIPATKHTQLIFYNYPHEQIATITKNLQIALQNCLSVWLASNSELRNFYLIPKEHEVLLFESHRKDCWIFAQLVRAFSVKLYAVSTTKKADEWHLSNVFQFEKDFRKYFYSIGFSLLQIYNYPHLKKLVASVEDLHITQSFDPTHIVALLPEWEQVYTFLLQLFEQISNLPVLIDIPFDIQKAIDILQSTFEAEKAAFAQEQQSHKKSYLS